LARFSTSTALHPPAQIGIIALLGRTISDPEYRILRWKKRVQ
jgi:hypothetical protein